MLKDKNPYRILVIEDNPGDFAIVEDFLLEQIAEPDIVHATTFTEAKKLLSGDGLPFDVTILDLTLPDKNGRQLITEMLEDNAQCPIIILTGYANIEFSIESIGQGVYDYLLKDELASSALYKSILYTIERKKNSTDLLRSEKRYSDLFNLSPQPMWLYDPKTLRFIQVNKAAIEKYGYSEAEFLAMTIMDIRPPSEIEKVKAFILKKVLAENKDTKGEFIHCKKSGEKINV